MFKKIVMCIAIIILLLGLLNKAFNSMSYVKANPAITAVTSQGALASNRYSAFSTPPQIEWNKTYGTEYWDRASSVVQTSDGGYAMAGTLWYQDGFSHFLLIKTDA